MHQARLVFLRSLLTFTLVSLIWLILPIIQVHADTDALKNTFGARKQVTNNGTVPKVQGVDAYMTTPDTPIPIGSGKSAGPVGITNYFTMPYAESGPSKTCPLTCEYHPYSAYRDINGVGSEVDRVDLNLLPGGWYHYKTFFLSNNIWRIQFCDGNGCLVLRDVDLKTSAGVAYAIAGGEGLNTNFGPVTSAAFKWRNKAGTWANSCYTDILRNVNGRVTACGGNFDWTVQYP
ncbi:MAG TPA: hypothetical protein VFD70_20635 [Anaerolineae bacterium]|nr:hypothetical protein [Anaerolineae bacterium]